MNGCKEGSYYSKYSGKAQESSLFSHRSRFPLLCYWGDSVAGLSRAVRGALLNSTVIWTQGY